jgi:hypothetical protein
MMQRGTSPPRDRREDHMDDEKVDISFRGLQHRTGNRQPIPEFGPEACIVTPNPRALARVLQTRGAYGRIELARFEFWMMDFFNYSPTTAKRKRSLVWGCLCDYPDEPWEKVFHGYQGDRCSARAYNYTSEIRRALRDFGEWEIADPEASEEGREEGRELIAKLRYSVAESEIKLEHFARAKARSSGKPGRSAHPTARFVSAFLVPSSPPHATPLLEPATPREAIQVSPVIAPVIPAFSYEALKQRDWLSYAEAAFYTGFSVAYVRNLVSAGAIPVEGGPRARKFRREMLDLWLTDRDAAMRKFRLER